MPKAINMLVKAANKKHILAMYQLGICYYRGFGVEIDFDNACKWLGKAANYNLPDAIVLYAMIQLYKNNFLPFRDESSTKIIQAALSQLDSSSATPGYWVFKSIFKDFRHFQWNYFSLSSKHTLWAIDDYMSRVYYYSSAQYPYYKKIMDFRKNKKSQFPMLKDEYTKNIWDKAIENKYSIALLYKNRIMINY